LDAQLSAETPRTTWVFVTLPLILHFIFTLGVALFVLLYIDRNYFSLVRRTPLATLLDGSTPVLDGVRFCPLQSDITTILSLSLAVSRLFTTAWCGSLCWRCAIILMEKSGLTLGELGRLVSFGLPPSPFRSRLNRRGGTSAYTMAIVLVLLLVLPVQLAAPIITGSITWTPSFQQYNAPNLNVTVRHYIPVDGHVVALDPKIPVVRGNVERAAASGFRTWDGVGKETDAMKLVLSGESVDLLFNLPPNSTLNNITIPYFKVTSFTWIPDPERTLTPSQLGVIDMNNGTGWTNVSIDVNPLSVDHGVAIAATPQELLASTLTTQTYPVAFLAEDMWEDRQCNWDEWSRYARTVPTGVGFVSRSRKCYVFANVTYDVGAADCKACRLSSPSTVQSDNQLTLFQDDVARPAAMAIMAEVAYEMNTLESQANVPQSAWSTTEDYVISMLRRSYMASWGEFHSGVQELKAGVSLPIEFSQGVVDVQRVWLWFTLQMLVTMSGVLFIIVQMCTDRAPVRDTTLVGFFLDARDLSSGDDSLAITASSVNKGTVIGLRREGGRLLPKVEVCSYLE
jgi:hypothetical protein